MDWRTVMFLCAVLAARPALAANLVEPHMHIVPGGTAGPQVALTLDACTGGVDMRILSTLVENNIPATIFVTGRWLRGNAPAIAILQSHPDLFELEDHGLNHVPAVLGTKRVYGIKPAGTMTAIRAEISGGARAMEAARLNAPAWYRDATAEYSPAALKLIAAMGYRVGGFSLNADFGASLPAKKVEERISAAKDGDVIIAHINQPKRSSGAGVAAGVLALTAKGFRFVRLQDTLEPDAVGPIALVPPLP